MYLLVVKVFYRLLEKEYVILIDNVMLSNYVSELDIHLRIAQLIIYIQVRKEKTIIYASCMPYNLLCWLMVFHVTSKRIIPSV